MHAIGYVNLLAAHYSATSELHKWGSYLLSPHNTAVHSSLNYYVPFL